MPINYEVLQDNNLAVTMGAGRTIDFDLPRDAVIDDPDKAPIVAFMFRSAAVFPTSGNVSNPNSWNATLAVEVNDRRLNYYNIQFSETSVERSMHEVMDPNTSRRRLNHGRNTLHFEIDRGAGQVNVQDIVVWYHTA